LPNQPKFLDDAEKQVLRPIYVINGGKTIWLMDQVNMEMDSLMQTGENLSLSIEI
jgi:hypothetical protein